MRVTSARVPRACVEETGAMRLCTPGSSAQFHGNWEHRVKVAWEVQAVAWCARPLGTRCSLYFTTF